MLGELKVVRHDHFEIHLIISLLDHYNYLCGL